MADKDAYIDKLTAQLDEWKGKIIQLNAQADKAEAEAKMEYDKQIDQAELKVREFESKLDMLKSANEDAWEEIKRGVEAAKNDISKAISDATSKLS